MITEKEYTNFNIHFLPGNLDVMKSFFEKKKATCIMAGVDKGEYTFNYPDIFHSKKIIVVVNFNLNDSKKPRLKIRIEWDDSLNSYDMDEYANHLFSQIYFKLMEGPTRYVVRVYAKYYSIHPQNLNFVFEWGNKIKVTPFSIEERKEIFDADTVTSSPHEQVLLFDVEVHAVDVTSARTLAYNRAKEVFSYLAVLFDLGIEEFQSEQVFALADTKEGYNQIRMFGTAINKGFHDSEIDLFVFDNLNGLIAIDEGAMVLNEYLTVSFNDDEVESTVTTSNDNPQLDKIFKNRKVAFTNGPVERSDLMKEITFYNTPINILSSHLSFFRKLKKFEANNLEKFERFSNACKMYNKALTVCSNEPTMMVSYLIASLEALAKIEEKMDYLKDIKNDMNKFLAFAEAYSKDEIKFDRNYFKYLYGTVRSGHFHSGEFKYLEYNILLNYSLSNKLVKARNDLIRAKSLIRETFINWIEKNILSLV